MLLALMGGGSAVLGGLWLSADPEQKPSVHPPAARALAAPHPDQAQRLISLSPGVTEALVTLGLAGQIVGISNYCVWSETSLKEPARVGSALTPHFERMARLRPTLLVASEVAGQQLKPLGELAPTHSLPWLTVSEFVSSLARLGALTGRREAGRALAAQMDQALGVVPPPEAPMVLLAFEGGGASGPDTWFIRPNSIHGAVLRAAGAHNAVQEDVIAQPRLSPEELLRLDPEVIVVLMGMAPDANKEQESLQRFRSLSPLRAVRHQRLAVVSMEGALTIGPATVLELIPRLRQALAQALDRAPAPSEPSEPTVANASKAGALRPAKVSAP